MLFYETRKAGRNMQKTNQIFNDTYFCTRVLINSTKLRNTLEKNRDIEIESTDDENEKQEIQNAYRKKLQSIYRIRNNAFSFLLYSGFQCTYDINEDEKTFYMNIEGDVYDCKESAVKNILAKEFPRVVENCLSREEFDKIKDDINIVVPTQPVNVTIDSKVKHNLTDNEVNDLLDLFVGNSDVQTIDNVSTVEETKQPDIIKTEEKQLASKPVIAPVVKKEKISAPLPTPAVKETQPQKPKVNRCPRCFAPLSNKETICDFCGYNLNENKTLSRTEFNQLDNEKFSDEDIDKMFKELEKRLNEQSESNIPVPIPAVEKAKEQKPTPKPAKPVSKPIATDTTHVKLYEPAKSMPTIEKGNLIVDIYNLKMKDPKENNDEEDTTSEIHKRRRVDEPLVKLNSEIDDADNDIIRDIKMYVYPLTVPENGTELSSDVLVYIEQDGKSGLFCSGTEGVKTVRVDTNIHSFLVRGSWKDGIFESHVFLSGVSIAGQCEISRNLEKVRPSDNKLQLGHTMTTLSIEYVDGTESMKIHGIPLTETNDEDGLAKTIYLMENVSQRERKLYMTKTTNYISFDFEDEIYKASSTWSGDIFKTKVENY